MRPPLPRRSAEGAAFDRVTLHAFMFTLTLATAVALAYGPSEALQRIADVLSTPGNPLPDTAAAGPQIVMGD